MPMWVIFVGIGAVLVIVASVGYDIVAQKKLVERLNRDFGRDLRGRASLRGSLRDAERFWDSWEAAHKQRYVDDITWADLDMDEIFERINPALSSVGDIWLYAALRRPDTEKAAAREALVRRMEDDALRQKLSITLAKLGHKGGAGLSAVVFRAEQLKVRRWVYRLLAALPFAAFLVMLPFSPLGGVALFAGLLVINLAVCSAMREKSEEKILSVQYLAQVLRCARRLARSLEGEQAEKLRTAAKPFAFLGRSCDMLAADANLAAAFMPNPLAFFMIPMLSYCKVAARLPKLQAEMLALLEAVGEIELARAVASFRESLPLYCLPEWREEKGIEAKELYHPLLEDPVANNGVFRRGVLFTGSNASGKSTFIKAVAVNCLLGQSLYTCCASGFALRRGHVATSMAVEDSIVDGDSYFMAELKSLRRLVRFAQGGGRGYLFVDEILKGTNTVERIAGSASVLRVLADTDCLCFTASHDIELTEILADVYDNYHFRERVTEQGVAFDYLLREGPATSRNALLLLEQMGFPGGITGQARRLVGGYEQARHW